MASVAMKNSMPAHFQGTTTLALSGEGYLPGGRQAGVPGAFLLSSLHRHYVLFSSLQTLGL